MDNKNNLLPQLHINFETMCHHMVATSFHAQKKCGMNCKSRS